MFSSLSMTRLDRAAAAAHLTQNGLRIAPATLAKMAVRGDGPPYAVFNGRAVYDLALLDSWAETKTSANFNSTSERSASLRER